MEATLEYSDIIHFYRNRNKNRNIKLLIAFCVLCLILLGIVCLVVVYSLYVAYRVTVNN